MISFSIVKRLLSRLRIRQQLLISSHKAVASDLVRRLLPNKLRPEIGWVWNSSANIFSISQCDMLEYVHFTCNTYTCYTYVWVTHKHGSALGRLPTISYSTFMEKKSSGNRCWQKSDVGQCSSPDFCFFDVVANRWSPNLQHTQQQQQQKRTNQMVKPTTTNI